MSMFMTKSRAEQILQAQIEAKELQERKEKEAAANPIRSQAKSLWQRLGAAGGKLAEEADRPKERYLKKASGKGLPNFHYLKNKILERQYRTKSPEKKKDAGPKENYLKK